MDTTIAYLAGLVDGEAYIGIKKGSRRDCVNPAYHERIQVRMVHAGAIFKLRETLGGNFYREKPHANNGRPLYCWQASDRLAADILRKLLPHLIVKRDAAENVLRLRELKDARYGGPRTMPDYEVAERERLYLRAKELNRVGV